MNDYKGYISTEHTKKLMTNAGKKRGWRLTKQYGWLCSTCTKKENP